MLRARPLNSGLLVTCECANRFATTENVSDQKRKCSGTGAILGGRVGGAKQQCRAPPSTEQGPSMQYADLRVVNSQGGGCITWNVSILQFCQI